jgi:selenocysteine lyase/cysteine desulfurase
VNVSLLDVASARLDLDPRGVEEGLRASVHYYNDDSDLERLIEGVSAA